MKKSLWDPVLHLQTLEFSKNKGANVIKSEKKIPLLRHDSLEGTVRVEIARGFHVPATPAWYANAGLKRFWNYIQDVYLHNCAVTYM